MGVGYTLQARPRGRVAVRPSLEEQQTMSSLQTLPRSLIQQSLSSRKSTAEVRNHGNNNLFMPPRQYSTVCCYWQTYRPTPCRVSTFVSRCPRGDTTGSYLHVCQGCPRLLYIIKQPPPQQKILGGLLDSFWWLLVEPFRPVPLNEHSFKREGRSPRRHESPRSHKPPRLNRSPRPF